MIVRKVTLKDTESLKLIKPSIDLDTITNRLKKQSENKVEFLLLEVNNKPTSFALLKWGGKDTHPEYPDIEDLYTKESERGKGLGSYLINECEKRVKKKGYTKIGLAVNPTENNQAKILYEKLGYRSTNEKPYVDGVYNGIEDWCIDMEKILTWPTSLGIVDKF